jgi:hypothetical protein
MVSAPSPESEDGRKLRTGCVDLDCNGRSEGVSLASNCQSIPLNHACRETSLISNTRSALAGMFGGLPLAP